MADAPGRGRALTQLARLPMRTLRPADASAVYAQPRQQLARLAANGEVRHVANGYYTVVPLDQRGTDWKPTLEAVAAGIAVATYGPDNAVLMGVSAARVHGAIPRALATAVVAIPRQRPAVNLKDRDALVVFVKRDVDRLEVERMPTDLGRTLVTTLEQTVLDLAHRPTLGNARADVPAAVHTLLARCDRDLLDDLATRQRLGAARDRAVRIAA
ncbi:MAG TPA: type IV toxin-antitoxin system AbiEi family antitoxin [Pseudonocardiaceae bacterium]|nr:type IV toxin-antitoxin system AbiEi family antitoxin [Pseudonocardiaceae bacterium]